MTHAAALKAAADALELAADALRSAATVEPEVVTPELVSVEDASRALGVSRTALYALMDRGRLRSHKLGRRRLVARAALEELLDASEVRS